MFENVIELYKKVKEMGLGGHKTEFTSNEFAASVVGCNDASLLKHYISAVAWHYRVKWFFLTLALWLSYIYIGGG